VREEGERMRNSNLPHPLSATHILLHDIHASFHSIYRSIELLSPRVTMENQSSFQTL
jgi:hypothetical protein